MAFTPVNPLSPFKIRRKMNNKLFNDNFLDSLEILSFVIGIMNYQENLSQSDKDDIIHKSSEAAQRILEQLEKDLDEQNEMLREIIAKLEKLEVRDDLRRNNNETSDGRAVSLQSES